MIRHSLWKKLHQNYEYIKKGCVQFLKYKYIYGLASINALIYLTVMYIGKKLIFMYLKSKVTDRTETINSKICIQKNRKDEQNKIKIIYKDVDKVI